MDVRTSPVFFDTLPKLKHLFSRGNISLTAIAKTIDNTEDDTPLRLHVKLTIYWIVADAAGDGGTTTYSIVKYKTAICTMSCAYHYAYRAIGSIPHELLGLMQDRKTEDVVGEAFQANIKAMRSFSFQAIGALQYVSCGADGSALELAFHAKVFPEGHEDIDRCKGWQIWGRYSEVQIKFEQTDCPICLDKLGAFSEVSVMPCFHVFHGVCLAKSLRLTNSCPICRSPGFEY